MLFHVSGQQRHIGETLTPGHLGSVVRRFHPGGPFPDVGDLNFILWEVALETARLASAPNAPSRTKCLFAFEAIEPAMRFVEKYRKHGSIYGIEYDAETARTHRADFNAISTLTRAEPYVDYMSRCAQSYWTPSADCSFAEILIGGPITIVTDPL